MCQLKAGALFNHKRKKVEELKELFTLLRIYKNSHLSVRNSTYPAVHECVCLGMAIQARKGDLRAARLIQQRALKMGVLA